MRKVEAKSTPTNAQPSGPYLHQYDKQLHGQGYMIHLAAQSLHGRPLTYTQTPRVQTSAARTAHEALALRLDSGLLCSLLLSTALGLGLWLPGTRGCHGSR